MVTVAQLVTALGVFVLCQATAAQDAAEQDTGDAADRQVAVTTTTSDRSIADRLVGILIATDRFEAPTVRVDDGVVFLDGTAESDDAKQWAGDLAGRTEGVVAVNNGLAVAPQPIWSLEPALAEARALWRDVVTSAPLFAVGVAGLLLVALMGRGASRLASRWFTGGIESQLVRTVIEKTLFLIILLISVYFFLRVSGLTRLAVTVVGGTGVAGVILGFAFRDIAENFLASVLISVQRPFRLGDVIEVEGHLGIVQKVTMRGTLLMDFDGNHIQIANASVYKSTIKNFTANPKARIGFAVGIGYDDDVERAQQIAADALRSHPAILKDPTPQVLVDGLAASTVNLQVFFWIDGSEHSVLKLKSVAQRHVLDALIDAGVSLPDEQREIIFPDGVPVAIDQSRDGGVSPAQPPRRRRAQHTPAGELDAEGGVASEAEEIRRQASAARQPEEGSDILSSTTDD